MSNFDKKWAEEQAAEGKLQYLYSIELTEELNGPDTYNEVVDYGEGHKGYYLKADTLVKFICPSCKTDKLVVYYKAGAYETRARCTSCEGVDFCVHSG